MSKAMKWAVWAMAAAFIGLSSACAPTAERRATGEFIDDAALTTRVKTALVKADGINANAINVNTYRGEVILSGFVESETMIRRADAVARGVDGVRVVRNDLRVAPRR